MIIGEYSPRRSRGEYSPIITEPEVNTCFSINTQVIIPKTKGKSIVNTKKNYFMKSAPTTGSHYVRLGDYRLIVRSGIAKQSERVLLCNHLSIYTING